MPIMENHSLQRIIVPLLFLVGLFSLAVYFKLS